MQTSNANFDRFKAAERQLAELQNDLVLSGHERNILMNSLVKCGCKQDPQCPDQWYNERAETAERQLAQINESRPFALLRRYGSLGAGMDSNYYYSCKDADPELNRLTQQNRALRLQLEKLQKRFDSAWDHIAATSIALGTPVGMNNADYAAQLKLDNAQKDARIAELESRKA